MCPKLAQICGDLLGSDTCVARISGDYVKQCHAGTLSGSYREVFGNYCSPGSIRVGVLRLLPRSQTVWEEIKWLKLFFERHDLFLIIQIA